MPEIVVLGERLQPLEPVSKIGALLGLSHGQAFRAASTWPTVGSAGARRVVVPKLLGDLGIEFSVVSDTCGCQMGDSVAGDADESVVAAGQRPHECTCPRDSHTPGGDERPPR